jgi:hypothetical protein
MNNGSKGGIGQFFRSRFGIALLVFLAIGAFLLITEHMAHIFTGNGFLALLLLACIGMHFFMHGGHRGHGGEPGGENERRKTMSGESGRPNP